MKKNNKIVKIENNNIYNMDCLEGMKLIKDKSIDCIICDLPYGTTAHKWDSIIPFDKLWSAYERIIKDDGVIVLFATQPFTSKLICSNLDLYRYSWIWKKDKPTGHLNSKYAPLKATEDICIFSKSKVGSLSKNKIKYHPPTLKEVNVKKKNNPNNTYRKSQGYKSDKNILNTDKEFIQKYTNHPTNILTYSREKKAVHPTQKPIDLLSFLIKTYTKPGDIILDNTMGSGSTIVSAILNERDYIGFELDKSYFKIAEKRVNSLKKPVINVIEGRVA